MRSGSVRKRTGVEESEAGSMVRHWKFTSNKWSASGALACGASWAMAAVFAVQAKARMKVLMVVRSGSDNMMMTTMSSLPGRGWKVDGAP